MRNNDMQYKKLKTPVVLLMVVCIAGAFASCKKFLDVPPENKVPQATLFQDEQGFKDALNGVYLAMDKPSPSLLFGLYTGDMTMGMMATLAYDYDNATAANVGANSTFFNNAVAYNYTDAVVKGELDAIWSVMYNNIANLNNILEQVDQKKQAFTADNFSRVKGEAIALRALFHFDLARMYGQPPATGMNVKAIPYITKVWHQINSFLYVAGCAGLLHCRPKYGKRYTCIYGHFQCI
jgi:hypothetical protein